MGVLMMSAATSYALYRVPHLQAKTDQRIKNGIGKFAAHYMRYRQWAMAAQLYETLHHDDPERTSILRKLAKTYREMGEREHFEEVLAKAIAIDLRRYRRNPRDIQVNQSLARSYRLVGEHPKANEHLAQALDAALERVTQNPESARAAYRLGKTYELLGQSMPAAKHFKLAYDLKPTSSKYRKAAFKTRKDMELDSK